MRTSFARKFIKDRPVTAGGFCGWIYPENLARITENWLSWVSHSRRQKMAFWSNRVRRWSGWPGSEKAANGGITL